MGMFTRLFGGAAGAVERSARAARATNLAAPSPGTPSYAVAIPKQLMVEFHAHDSVDGVSGNFLSALTEGLLANGQPELVLTLRLGNREDPLLKMQQLLPFFSTVHAWALEGRRMLQGGATQFGERGLFGRAHSGLLYAPARAIGEVSFADGTLAAIFVEPQEVRAALDYGTYRVLTRLGLQLRLFPYPVWGALDRPNTITPKEVESRIAKIARVRAPEVSFLVSDDCLRLTLPSDAGHLGRGMSARPVGVPFVLLTRPAVNANAILVWRPGQQGTRGISPDGSDRSRLSGSCLIIVPGTETDGAETVEDGYSIQFSRESWAVVATALIEQQPLSMQLGDQLRFELEWLPSARHGV